MVWPGAGHRHRTCRAHVARAAGWRSCGYRCLTDRTNPARLRSWRGAEVGAVLVDVCDVCHGRHRWPDGDGATRSVLPGLRHRYRTGVDSRDGFAGARFRVVARPCAERSLTAVLRLAV